MTARVDSPRAGAAPTGPGCPPDALERLALLAPLTSIERVPVLEAPGPLTLGAGDVHLWYCFYDQVTDPRLLEAYAALMTPDESAQHRRFVFEKDRHEYLVTRALVRTVLSRYAGVEPAALRFVRNEFGRPFMSGPPGVPWPSFNLSNTRGLIACAVGAPGQGELGVDVEDVERRGETVSIAESVFSKAEVRALRSLPAARQRERFFAYWTLKESYIKARSMGLSIPLDQFSFHLDEGPGIRISFDPLLKDDAGSWRFALLRASPRHFLALACRSRDAATPRIRARHAIPLEDAT